MTTYKSSYYKSESLKSFHFSEEYWIKTSRYPPSFEHWAGIVYPFMSSYFPRNKNLSYFPDAQFPFPCEWSTIHSLNYQYKITTLKSLLSKRPYGEPMEIFQKYLPTAYGFRLIKRMGILHLRKSKDSWSMHLYPIYPKKMTT